MRSTRITIMDLTFSMTRLWGMGGNESTWMGVTVNVVVMYVLLWSVVDCHRYCCWLYWASTMKPLVLCPLACSNRSGGLLPAARTRLEPVKAAVHDVWSNLLVWGTPHSLPSLPTGETTISRSTKRISRGIVTIGSERAHLLGTGISGFPARKKRQISMSRPKRCIARNFS